MHFQENLNNFLGIEIILGYYFPDTTGGMPSLLSTLSSSTTATSATATGLGKKMGNKMAKYWYLSCIFHSLWIVDGSSLLFLTVMRQLALSLYSTC